MSVMQQKLEQDLNLLKKQIFWLEISFEQCRNIGVKAEYSIEEFGHFEALCSRYGRSMDFLVRKIFRSIDAYELEAQGTLIDVVNRAHKRGLVDDIEQVRIMKDVRNTIVHEYIEEHLQRSFGEVLKYSEVLLQWMRKTETYITQTLPSPVQ